MKKAFTYVAFTTDADYLLGGLFDSDKAVNDYMKTAADDGYDDIQVACVVPLTVRGDTHTKRKTDFIRKVEVLATYPVELIWWQDGLLTEWIEKNAARTGSVKQLHAMGIL